MSELVVETHGLTKRYGSLAAVDGLEMRVERGSVYGFIGRNGAGKTTTLRMLAGLTQATSGTARVLGLEAHRDQIGILARTGFVIDTTLLKWMNGTDLVRFNRGFFPRWNDGLVKRYAEALEIPMNRAFKKLSHGNKTKLCLLLALAQNPELLVLDEPTGGLDPVVTDQLLRVLMEDFAGDGRTILMSSHHLSEVERIADWVGMVDKGKLLLEARLDDIRSNFRRVRAVGDRLPASAPHALAISSSEGMKEYVLSSGAEAFAASLSSQGAVVLDVQPLNLSEIFLVLVGKENYVPVEVLA